MGWRVSGGDRRRGRSSCCRRRGGGARAAAGHPPADDPGVAGAVALGEWGEAATVAFLFGLAEALEAQSLARARRAVRSLLEVAPETAERIEPGGGDAGRPRRARSSRAIGSASGPGERVPVDGRVVAGRSAWTRRRSRANPSRWPSEPGDEVFAGTVNGDGTLEVEATRPLSDSVVARTIELVRAAQAAPDADGAEHRAVRRRSIRRWPSPWPLLLMVGPPLALRLSGRRPAAWREWFLRGLVVLVVACPCALVIGTPVAVVSALAAAARRGVLVKGGQFLEAVGRLRVLAFDKTGTLTRGEPSVVEVVPAADGGRPTVAPGSPRRWETAAATSSAGPSPGTPGTCVLASPRPTTTGPSPAWGRPARSRRRATTSAVTATSTSPGSATTPSTSRLATPSAAPAPPWPSPPLGGPLGWIRLADRPRPEAADVLAELAGLGLATVMLTGDNAPTAAAIARELGLSDHRAGLLPADKARAVAELDAEHGPTGMVGDGVNDAPALAAARVSVALGGISSGAPSRPPTSS